jgi:hypothetical protein
MYFGEVILESRGALRFMWSSPVCRQIVIDVRDIPQCFIPDVSGLEIFHHFLPEGQ